MNNKIISLAFASIVALFIIMLIIPGATAGVLSDQYKEEDTLNPNNILYTPILKQEEQDVFHSIQDTVNLYGIQDLSTDKIQDVSSRLTGQTEVIRDQAEGNYIRPQKTGEKTLLDTKLSSDLEKPDITEPFSSDRLTKLESNGDTIGESNKDLHHIEINFRDLADISTITHYLDVKRSFQSDKTTITGWADKENILEIAKLPAVSSIDELTTPVRNIGSVMTEGDKIIGTDVVREKFGANGTGIKVGVISDGVDHLNESQATGDLPLNVHVLSNAYGGDEGVSMLEIIHDIAPGAELYFHDCGSNYIEFNSALDALNDAGCQIVVDDISWLQVPYFEDGMIATHLNDILKNNPYSIHITAAGNDAGRHYQGMYVAQPNDTFADLSDGTSPYKDLYVKVPRGGYLLGVLQWDDPWDSSKNDYDLYMYNAKTGDILSYSKRLQNGDDKPLEKCIYENTGSETITVGVAVENFKKKADPRILEIYLYPLGGSKILPDNIRPEDSIFGHAAVPSVITVGAISQTSQNKVLNYSSQGPVTIIYPKQEIRRKPDVVAPSGVSVTRAGSVEVPFIGTSASAAHIAGLTASIWSAFPNMTAGIIKSALYDTANDLGEAGWDPVNGYGSPNAVKMYEKLQGMPVPSLNFTPTKIPVHTPTPVTTKKLNPGEHLIEGPAVINKSGVYLLDNDLLLNTEPVIHVMASDVVIDGQGHTIEGIETTIGLNTSQKQFGIFVTTTGSNKTIERVTIKNLKFTNLFCGIALYNTKDVSIENCDFEYNYAGISILGSSKSKIVDSQGSGNIMGIMVLKNSKDNIISKSSFSKNLVGAVFTLADKNTVEKSSFILNENRGIVLTGEKNILKGNVISGNSNDGVFLTNANQTEISTNLIENNDMHGVLISNVSNNTMNSNLFQGNFVGIGLNLAEDNLIYNNLFNNQKNFYIYNLSTSNKWNIQKKTGPNIIGGPYIGGNFWGSLDGTGFSENPKNAGKDGFTTRDFVINENNIDKLPLSSVKNKS